MIIRFSWTLGVILLIVILCSKTVVGPVISVGSGLDTTSAVTLGDDPTDQDEPLLFSRQVEVAANSTVSLQWSSVPADVRYVLFQAHAQRLSLSLAQQNTLIPGNHVNGTNTGLVVLLAPGELSAGVYLLNSHGTNVTALLVAVGYTEQDPVVGACNMEFETETAPYLRLRTSGFTSILEFQRSRLGWPRALVTPPKCDVSLPALDYSVYQYFMKERQLAADEYFRAIAVMLSVDSIERSAIKGGATRLGPSTRSAYNGLPGQGVVFNVVVRDSLNRSWVAAYTPAATYACDLDMEQETCSLLIQPFGWIFCVVCSFVGLFLCFFGHRFFKIEMFIFGFLTFALIAFVTITKFSVSTYSVRVSMTMILGTVGGVTWVVFWWFAGVPVLSVLLAGLDLGFMMACVVFYTPFGQLSVLTNDANYWLSLMCITLIPCLFLSCTIHKLSILACAVIGSYGVVLLLDLYLGTSLVYILLNVLKRAVIEDFYTLNTHTPFQINEMALVAVWIFLAGAGVTVQVLRERNRPPFPPPPYLAWRQVSLSSEATSAPPSPTPRSTASKIGTDDSDLEEDERRPLLAATSGPTSGYRSTGVHA